jgi:hypothetical protein
MKRLLSLVTLAVLAVAPSTAQPQSPAMAKPAVGVGPHGYDWLIGTWNCTNSTPSAISGPATSSYTVTRTIGGGLYIRTSGKNFDSSSYIAYSAKTKTWAGPASFADGSYEFESSTGTGNKVTWAGTYVAGGLGKAVPVRDNYTLINATKQTDVGQTQSGGTWKTLYTVACTKS